MDYAEFVKMLSAWRGQGQMGTGSVNTGLTWDFEKPAESPHKKADEQREAVSGPGGQAEEDTVLSTGCGWRHLELLQLLHVEIVL